MVAQPETFDEEQQPLVAETPSRSSRRLLTAGICAGLALAAVGAATASHIFSGSESSNVSSVGEATQLNEESSTTLGQAPSLKSFESRSKPYLGGRGDEAEGKLYINEDGKMNAYYLPGADTVNNFTSVKYTPPYRFYLMKEHMSPPDYSKSENFYKPLLVGKTFSVDIDVSQAGCGCNINFYMVDMPAASRGKDNDYYCDGQCFDGLGCCAEWDMNEGNSKVQQITNHACTHNYGGIGHSDWQCHKWGDPEVKTSTNMFGNNAGATIDSSKPFTFSQRYELEGGRLKVTTIMEQGERRVVLPMGPSDELDAMYKTGSLEKGMVLVTGYWTAGDMNWLDGQACGSAREMCSSAPAYISNWRITTNSGPAPGPSPGPSPSGSGKCCWKQCGTNCPETGDWCGQSAANCGQCGGGTWCQ
mmetsp:Transcript_76569/g.167294  ORF Transcript_76569/g.167294 Transcript_76569/m.167294 type:complete len:417 (+) Transcript_76569:80-1330(+)